MFIATMLGLAAVAAVIVFFAMRQDASKVVPANYVQTKPILEISALDLKDLVTKSDAPVIVLFHSPTCPGCQTQKPNFQTACNNHKGNTRFVMINVMENKSTARRLGIKRIPTTMVFKGSDESALASHIGTLTAIEVEALITTAITGH